jgi:hypothetical protein
MLLHAQGSRDCPGSWQHALLRALFSDAVSNTLCLPHDLAYQQDSGCGGMSQNMTTNLLAFEIVAEKSLTLQLRDTR